MNNSKNFLALDFGASSGRGIIGKLQNNRLALEEIHRFPNKMVYLHNSYHWDVFRLYDEILIALKESKRKNLIPSSIAVDTWGVDYGLFDRKGKLLGIPHAYRDHRTDNAIEDVLKIIPGKELYGKTGIQFMQFNTIFQLFAAKQNQQPALEIAKDLLFMPDIFNYFLSGVMSTEFSFATTSQLYNPLTGRWEKSIFDTLGLKADIMQEIVKTGTVLGQITDEVKNETGLPDVDITSVASHDTGSAIAAIPATDDNFAYISSGTWSLMGIESEKPIISEKSYEWSFTNEGGVENTIRVLKNIMGLWLIQECKRGWDNEGLKLGFPEIVKKAKEAKPFKSLIDPDYTEFLNPDNMQNSIKKYCADKNQSIPESVGEVARTIFESLALKYRYTLDGLREISDKKIERIHIIGGGSQNELLCQFTANATGLPVIAGPAEGTALGNIVVQAMAQGEFKNRQEFRQVIKKSFEFKEFLPQDSDMWNDAYGRFSRLISNT